MEDKEFEEEYAEELKQLRLQLKLTVKAIEILFEELQKSNLPENVKTMMIQNYKIKGE